MPIIYNFLIFPVFVESIFKYIEWRCSYNFIGKLFHRLVTRLQNAIINLWNSLPNEVVIYLLLGIWSVSTSLYTTTTFRMSRAIMHRQDRVSSAASLSLPRVIHMVQTTHARSLWRIRWSWTLLSSAVCQFLSLMMKTFEHFCQTLIQNSSHHVDRLWQIHSCHRCYSCSRQNCMNTYLQYLTCPSLATSGQCCTGTRVPLKLTDSS